MTRGPVLIDMGDKPLEAGPAEALPPPDQGAALQRAFAVVARKPSRLTGWFWATLGVLIGVISSIVIWDFVNTLIARWTVLGWAVTGLVVLLGVILIAVSVKELATFSRLRRIDGVKNQAERALVTNDLGTARNVVERLDALYGGRSDTRWGRARLAEWQSEQFEAATLLELAESEILEPLDAAAQKEIEVAARQVALVTAMVPLAFADVLTALTVNLRMIRRIAEIYGGCTGFLGSWRLTRAVMAHLVATGAVAVGDDLITSVAGGGILSKLSRRFGEGIVNGALTARVGLAAIEVCRPMPFVHSKRPSVTGLVKRALTGIFG